MEAMGILGLLNCQQLVWAHQVHYELAVTEDELLSVTLKGLHAFGQI